MKKYNFFVKILLILITILGLTSCQDKQHFFIEKRDYIGYLDTISVVTVEYDDRVVTLEQVKSDLKQVDEILLNIEVNFSISQTIYMLTQGITHSTLMIINERSGKVDENNNKLVTTVDDDFITLTKMAIDVANDTAGGFDATIGPLTKLWDISGRSNYCQTDRLDYDSERCYIPSVEDINLTKELVDYTKIEIDQVNKTVYLNEPGMKLDFGAIAKGFAADKVLEFLISKGYGLILVNLGGNVYNYGRSQVYQKDILTHIRSPFPDNPYIAEYLISLHTNNATVVTSGINERYIEVDGNKYHHLINPKTGYPYENEIETVTIICQYQSNFPSSAYADALATGIYALGLNEGRKFIESNENLKAVFITKDKRIYLTKGVSYELGDHFTSDYRIFEGDNEIKK